MKTCKIITYIIIIIVALFAVACDGTSTDEYLDGDFIDVSNDTSPPDILLPVLNEKVLSSPVVLLWTSRKGASSYTVEVTRDINGDFSTQIAGSPFTVTAPDTALSLDLPVQSSTYVWRVRADVTETGQYGQSLFEGMDDSLYVFCHGDILHPDDTGMTGNISKPFQTIMGAIAEANTLNLSKVKVASRQSVPGIYSTYNETIVLESGISLLGAYTPDFAEENRDLDANKTYLKGLEGYTVYAQNIALDTVLEGFSINGSTMGLNAYAIYLVDCTTRGLHIQSNIINGNDLDYFPDSHSGVIYLDNSGPTIENNTINAGPADELSFGIYLNGGSAKIINNTITAEGADSSYGIYNDGPSVIQNNVLSLGVESPSLESYGIYNTSGVWISENTITKTDYGIYNTASSNTVILNNLILCGSYSDAYGMYIEDGSTAELYNNTIIGATASNVSYGLRNLSSSITMINNIVASFDSTGSNYGYNGVSCTHSYNCFYAASGSAVSTALKLGTSEIIVNPMLDSEYRLTEATDETVKYNGDDLYWVLTSLATTRLMAIVYFVGDRDGKQRTTNDGGWSMGAFEY